MKPLARKRTIICAISICLLSISLAGCFFLPGRFQSELRIEEDGQFFYSYIGEMVFLFPEERLASWDDSMARCHDEMPDGYTHRACRADEIAQQRADFESRRREDLEDGQSLAALVGYNPVDPAANHALASELEQYPGWKKVEYMGGGRFFIDYELRGRLDRDFIFPVIPRVQMAMPFLLVSPKADGKISVTAAGLASPQLRNALAGRASHSSTSLKSRPVPVELRNLSQGRFVVTTAGKITKTNGMKGRNTDLRRVEWVIKGIDSPTPNLEVDLTP